MGLLQTSWIISRGCYVSFDALDNMEGFGRLSFLTEPFLYTKRGIIQIIVGMVINFSG